jgi:hypothetical protein
MKWWKWGLVALAALAAIVTSVPAAKFGFGPALQVVTVLASQSWTASAGGTAVYAAGPPSAWYWDGQDAISTSFTISSTGYYTMTVPAGIWYGTGGFPTMLVYIDNQPIGHGLDLISSATNAFTIAYSPNTSCVTGNMCNFLNQVTPNIYLYAGSHTMQVACGGCNAYGMRMTDITFQQTTIGGAPSEPAGSRDPTVQPFRSYQWLNNPIGSSATWCAATDADCAQFLRAAWTVQSNSYSYPIYVAQVSDPNITLETYFSGVPWIPTPVTAAWNPSFTPAAGGDHNMVVYNPAHSSMTDGYNCTIGGAIVSGTYNSGTGVITLTMSAAIAYGTGVSVTLSNLAGTGGFATLAGTWTTTTGTVSGMTTVVLSGPTGAGASTLTSGLANPPSYTALCAPVAITSVCEGQSAAGFGVAGVVRVSELLAGFIPHAIQISLDFDLQIPPRQTGAYWEGAWPYYYLDYSAYFEYFPPTATATVTGVTGNVLSFSSVPSTLTSSHITSPPGAISGPLGVGTIAQDTTAPLALPNYDHITAFTATTITLEYGGNTNAALGLSGPQIGDTITFFNGIPPGGTLGIPSSVNCGAQGLTATGAAVCLALQNYGTTARASNGGDVLYGSFYCEQNCSVANASGGALNQLLDWYTDATTLQQLMRVMRNTYPSKGGGTALTSLQPRINSAICPQ